MALNTNVRAPLPENPSGYIPLTLVLPDGAAGQWCRVVVTWHRPDPWLDPPPDSRPDPWPDPWWVKLEAVDLARGHVVREAFLGPARRRGAAQQRTLLLHVPMHADRLVLSVITARTEPAPPPNAELRVLTRAGAALRLLAAGWRRLPVCLFGDPAGLIGRMRAELGQAPARAGEAPPYAVWLQRHDRWGLAEQAALARHAAGWPSIEVLVAGAGAQTLPNEAAHWLQPSRVSLVEDHQSWKRLPATWLLVLQAGEHLAPHALACFARAIQAAPNARAFTADCDTVISGQRQAPLFKPMPDAWLQAGLLTRGACVFHPDSVVPIISGSGPDIRTVMARDIPAEMFRRVPFILTHVPPTVASPRPHCTEAILPKNSPMVSIIIPSSCRRAHVLRCLRRLSSTTDYPNFEILLAVSSVDPDDRRQRAILQRAAALARVRTLDLGMTAFNYAAVNNAAARHADGDLLLLLNDDVMPIRADWLRRMAAVTEMTPAADIVGARLLYGNNRVQHGGVIMGLAGLCEHAFRLAARHDGGPHGMALLDRQVSAVTAACMLVRRTLWNRIGGMDESFAIALNDVDFCLRAAQAGARTVMKASVELYHYESLSLGRHYEGARAGLEALEVQSLRHRWQSVVADDPFYNPQAALEPGREFQPAFPPRLTPLCWIAGENPAQP